MTMTNRRPWTDFTDEFVALDRCWAVKGKSPSVDGG